LLRAKLAPSPRTRWPRSSRIWRHGSIPNRSESLVSAYDEDDFDETGALRPDRADKEISGPEVDSLDGLDDRYVKVQAQFVKDVEEYFERNSPRGY
jgi:hypothetical protein